MSSIAPENIFHNETFSITCQDLSYRYFGDFHVVSLEIKCEMDILPTHCKNPVFHEEITSCIGDKICFSRQMKQMGVPTARVSKAKDELIDNFKNTTLPYFLSSSFPSKAILSEIRKSRNQGRISAEAIDSLCDK